MPLKPSLKRRWGGNHSGNPLQIASIVVSMPVSMAHFAIRQAPATRPNVGFSQHLRVRFALWSPTLAPIDARLLLTGFRRRSRRTSAVPLAAPAVVDRRLLTGCSCPGPRAAAQVAQIVGEWWRRWGRVLKTSFAPFPVNGKALIKMRSPSPSLVRCRLVHVSPRGVIGKDRTAYCGAPGRTISREPIPSRPCRHRNARERRR